MTIRILVAPNAFKGGLSATEVAEAIAMGFRMSPLDCETVEHPVGDGGDGTAALLTRHFKATLVRATVHDPIGRQISAAFGLTSDGKTAILGMSDASGLRLLADAERDPLHATSQGTGELIACALDSRASSIILGVGGSATVDGGVGIARALGARFLDGKGQELPPGPAALVDLASIDLGEVHPRASRARITILCDVDNPLLGDTGAAAVFGPQKGARPEDVALLERALMRFAVVLLNQTGINLHRMPRGGAAGGAAAGLHAMLGAELVQGVAHFLDITGFDDLLAETDLVVTGEGAIDDQTLGGKAPMGVALRARALGIPVFALAGQVPLNPSPELRSAFDFLMPIGNGPASLGDALRDARCNLERSASQIGAMLAAPKRGFLG